MHVDVGSEKVVGLLHLDAGLAIVIGEKAMPNVLISVSANGDSQSVT